MTMKRHSMQVDRISSLPDLVRSHIVSFLPLKHAIRTSILSKRWRDICSSLSNLDFEEVSYHERGLKDIVDQTFLLHNGSDIRTFKLDVIVADTYVSAIHLNRWITFSLRHNVMEFRLYVHKGDVGKLPSLLFTSTSLTTLDLSSMNLKLPTEMNCPVLKTLTLNGITFFDEYLTNKLLSDSSCPVLENLEVSYCNFCNITTLSISVRSLKFLKLLNEELENKNPIKICLSNPNLHKIVYASSRLPEISSETLSSLLKASFELLSSPSNSDVLENLASKIVMGMRNVQRLRLLGYYMQFLTRVQDLLACLPTSCCSLRHLLLQLDSTENQLRVVNFLLRSYPNLQKLCIFFFEDPYTLEELLCMHEYCQPKMLCSENMLQHLRTVEIDNIRGSEWELHLVNYLLENAKILDEIRIRCISITHPETITLESRMQISQKLLNFTRVSPRAKIVFS